MFDLAVLIVAHVTLMPLWVALWVSIPLAIFLINGRPIFYRQMRIGAGGRIFRTYKFRTMRQQTKDRAWPSWTSDGDPRITRFGSFLRRTAIDELPQVINVFRGDLSLVGPRPLVVDQYAKDLEEEPRFRRRLRARPGLTGIAQIYLPRDCGPKQRLTADIFYIQRSSLWLDIKLIALSVMVTITGGWGIGKRTAVRRVDK